MTTFTRGILVGVLIACMGLVSASSLGYAVAIPLWLVLGLGLGLAVSPWPPKWPWRRSVRAK